MSFDTGVRSHASIVASAHASRIAAGNAARLAAAGLALLLGFVGGAAAAAAGAGARASAGTPGDNSASEEAPSAEPFVPEQRRPQDKARGLVRSAAAAAVPASAAGTRTQA
jgi:hypothetical protein